MLSFNNVTYQISNKCILKDFNYRFDTGVYILQGESGIGKTTLLNLSCGYLLPDAGTIERKRNSRISYMFQEDMLFHNLTVRENMNIKCNAVDMNDDVREGKIEQYCSNFKISDKMDCLVSSLSGGEKKRVQLAMLAMDDCEIWLLDEPIANLDSENCALIMDYLFSLNSKLILIVSHQFIEKNNQKFTLLEMKDGGINEK
nr:ATP-binding cassette domain-containing protein [Eubacterium sp.]